MKKKIALLLCLIMALSTGTFAETYNYPGGIDKSDSAYMDTYYISGTVQRYCPWFKLYGMQTKAQDEKGIYAGEGGQIVTALAMSPVDENYMMLGSDMSQAYRTTNGGMYWECLDSINTWAVTDIKFHPSSKNIVYIAEGTRDDINKLKNSTLDGIYKSMDGGKTFKQVLDKNILATTGSEDFIQFDENESIYVLTSEGVYKSSDTGKTWECLTTLPKQDLYVYTLSVTPDGKSIYATFQNGIMYSTNGGLVWNTMKNPEGFTEPVCGVMDPDDKNTFYAVYIGKYDSNKNYSGGLFVTKNKGETWEKIPHVSNNNGNNLPIFIKFGAKNDKGTRRMYMVYELMSWPIRMSEDYGKTWYAATKVNSTDGVVNNATGYYPEGLAVSENDPDKLYYSFGDIIYESLDGGRTFDMKCSGYCVVNATNITFAPDGKIWFAFMDKGVCVTDEAYKEGYYPTVHMLFGEAGLSSGSAGNVLINPKNPDDMITSIGNWSTGKFFRTLDGGKKWEPIMNNGQQIDAVLGVRSAYYPEKNIIYTNSYTSYDNGETWVENPMGIQAVSPVNKDVLYTLNDKTVMRSKDCGKTWEEVAAIVSSPQTLIADNFDANTCWVGSYNGSITKVVGNQTTILNQDNGLNCVDGILYTVTHIAQDPKNKDHLVAGGKCTLQGLKSPGLYETWDGGENWEIIPGMPGTKIFASLNFSPTTNEVFIGTCSNGTFIYEYENYKKFKEGKITVKNMEPKFEYQEKYTDGKIRVKLNGKLLSFDVEPFTINDRTVVPMRKIFEELGAEIEWDDATQTVTALYKGTTVKLTIGNDKAYINGEEKTLDVAAIEKDGRTLVPLRFVAESLGAEVNWDEANTLVTINK